MYVADISHELTTLQDYWELLPVVFRESQQALNDNTLKRKTCQTSGMINIFNNSKFL